MSQVPSLVILAACSLLEALALGFSVRPFFAAVADARRDWIDRAASAAFLVNLAVMTGLPLFCIYWVLVPSAAPALAH